jgi:hypothetical protein
MRRRQPSRVPLQPRLTSCATRSASPRKRARTSERRLAIVHDVHAIEKGIRIFNMKTEPKKGGARDGAGRKALPDGEAMVPVTVNMRPAQREKLQRLGGAPWVRKKIDAAKE